MRLRRYLVVCALAVLFAGATVGCSSTPDTTSTADGSGASDSSSNVLGTTSGPADATAVVDGGSLVFGIEAEPEGIDPTRYAFSSSGHFVASAVFDTLTAVDEDGHWKPYLASAVEHNDDFTQWTLTIRQGVTFHDGTPLTTQIVVDNLNAAQASYITSAALQTITSISAPDDEHVVIELDQPFVDFPSLLSTQVGYVIAPAMLDDPAMVDHPIGTGPFVFEGHEKDRYWSFTKNPSYWQEGLPHLGSLEFKPMPDNRARLEALRSGDIDLMNVRTSAEVLELRSSNDFKVVENASGEEDFIMLNFEKPPFDSLTARQAMAYATDAARWRRELQDDVVGVATSPFAPGQPGYLDANGYPAADLERAKELVQQYETETGQPFEFEFVTQADPNVVAESQLFQEMWEAAGMQVTVTALPQINLVAAVGTGSYQAGRFRLFSAANPDIDSYFWLSSSIQPAPGVSLNFPRFGSQAVDDAIATAIGSSDEATRRAAYETVNREFATNLPYIWLGRTVWALAANPRVQGIYAAKNGTVETIGSKPWIAELWLSE